MSAVREDIGYVRGATRRDARRSRAVEAAEIQREGARRGARRWGAVVAKAGLRRGDFEVAIARDYRHDDELAAIARAAYCQAFDARVEPSDGSES